MPAKCRSNRIHSRTKINLKQRSILRLNQKAQEVTHQNTTKQQSCSKFRKLLLQNHRHARRTNMHMNHHRAPIKVKISSKTQIKHKNKRLAVYLISEEYKRKMSDTIQVSDEQFFKKRKISWSDENQFVAFDKNHSCDSIRIAPRHKFSIDE